jgi:hypothetical protein
MNPHIMYHLTVWTQQDNIPLFVNKIGHYPIILGIPWLRWHDVHLRFAQNKVIFDSNYCLNHCLDALYVQGTTQDPPPLHLDSIAGPLGHIVRDAQQTQKVISPEYHDFLPLFLEEGSRQLMPKHPDIDTTKSISNLTFNLHLYLYMKCHKQSPRLERNG